MVSQPHNSKLTIELLKVSQQYNFGLATTQQQSHQNFLLVLHKYNFGLATTQQLTMTLQSSCRFYTAITMTTNGHKWPYLVTDIKYIKLSLIKHLGLPSTEDLCTFTHHILIPPAYHYVMLVAGNIATVTILEGMVTQCCFGGIVTIVFFLDIKYYYIYY